jgi:hypothetical protein
MSFSYSHAVTAATAANSENNTVEKGKYNSLASVTDSQGFLQNETRKKVTGAYIPQNMHLENMQQPNEQKDAISAFVEQGFDKYFFVMTDFENQTQVKLTEKLLDAADKATGLKIVIILLPPSEGGPISNYDWQGWVGYFNALKSRHPSSFDGFAIDDFNWISTRKDTKFWKNIDYMLFSNLSQALADKKDGVNFYPVVYFEGLGTDTVVNEYGRYANSIILVSASYYNVSKLEHKLSDFKEKFNNKPIEYIVYPTITYNYTRQGYAPPSDRLVMATLSIATRMADGIIFWHKIDSHVIQDYIYHRNDPNYIQAIYVMEQLQIANEQAQSDRKR